MEGLQVAYLLTKRGQVVKLETKQKLKQGRKCCHFEHYIPVYNQPNQNLSPC